MLAWRGSGLLVSLAVLQAVAVPEKTGDVHAALDFLADFLALQSRTIAATRISGIVCAWSRQDVIVTLSSRGLAARVFRDASSPTSSSSSTSSSSPSSSASTASNRLLHHARPDALLAIRDPALRALMQALSARGRPGEYGGPAPAEEVFVDMTCPSADLLLQVASDLNLFRRPFRWTLMQAECVDVVDVVTPRTALIDSQVTVACLDGLDGQVLEVHRAALGSAAVAERVASWHAGKLVLHRLQRGDAARHMQGITVTTGIALLDSNNSVHHLTDGREKELDQLTKSSFTLVLQAYELMNATMALHVSNSHGYVRNGTYDGLLGDLAKGIAEIGATCSVMVPFRLMVVSFTPFFMPLSGVFVFRQPPFAYTDDVFSRPFPGPLWAAALGLVAVCCVLAVLAVSMEEPVGLDRQDAVDTVTHDPRQPLGAGRGAPKQALRASASDVFLLAFGAICQQGSPVEARGAVGRIVTFSLFVAVLLLYTCYSASIVVLLQSSSTSIKTFRDIWKSRLEMGAENLPFNVFFFEHLYQTTDDEVRRGIYRDKMRATKDRPANFLSMRDGVRRIQHGLFAFHTLDSSLYGNIQATFEEHEKCDLWELKRYSYFQDPHIITRRNSPIRHLLALKLLVQWERGFRSRFIERCLYKRPQCDSQSRGAHFTSIDIVSVRGAYYLLGGGVAVSIVILAIELLVSSPMTRAYCGKAVTPCVGKWTDRRDRGD